MSKQKLAKTDVRYWQQAIFHPVYTRDGIRHLVPEWSVKIQHNGRRETFGLGTPNKAAAAERARQIYLGLQAGGWEAVLARFKEGRSHDSPVTTVGEFLEAVRAIWSGNAKTLADYSRAFRKIVADIFGLDGGKEKYDYRTGGRNVWIARVNAVKLSDVTPGRVQQWKVKFLRQAGNIPTRQRSASTSAKPD